MNCLSLNALKISILVVFLFLLILSVILFELLIQILLVDLIAVSLELSEVYLHIGYQFVIDVESGACCIRALAHSRLRRGGTRKDTLFEFSHLFLISLLVFDCHLFKRLSLLSCKLVPLEGDCLHHRERIQEGESYPYDLSELLTKEDESRERFLWLVV